MVVWPTYLPRAPQAYSEQPLIATTVQSPVTQGLPKVRRLFTKGVRTVTVTYLMTGQELSDFRKWIDTDLDHAVQAFLGTDWAEPVPSEVVKQIAPDSLVWRWIGGEMFEITFTEWVF